MELTKTETRIVRFLQRRRIATMAELRVHFEVSHMTVVRALGKHGYFSSYNANGAYYTLHSTPKFNEDGLWNCRKVRFSRYGTLTKTLVALVDNSPAGMTAVELEERLDSNVANVVSVLPEIIDV